MNRLYNVVLLLWLIAACTPLIPATTPPQLEEPPGTFVAVDEDSFDAGAFQVNYPDGWRVVKLSEANAPITATFASPDDEMTITLSELDIPVEECTPDPNMYERRESVTNNDLRIYSAGCAPVEQRHAFDEIYDNVLESITVP